MRQERKTLSERLIQLLTDRPDFFDYLEYGEIIIKVKRSKIVKCDVVASHLIEDDGEQTDIK